MFTRVLPFLAEKNGADAVGVEHFQPIRLSDSNVLLMA